MAINLPNFNPEKAEDYVRNYDVPTITEFVKLLYLRDIQGVSISESEFLQQQKKVLPILNKGMSPWIEKNRRRTFLSFQEVMAFFGYLGLNGTQIPELVDAVNHAFTTYKRQGGAFIASSGKVNNCGNTNFLRAVLTLGFAEDSRVEQACEEYLDFIFGREGECHVRTDGNPCGYVMVRTLRWLNEYPDTWQDKRYRTAVKNIQKYLLSHDLSTADFPRRNPEPNKNWFKYGYFRSYQSSIFEAAEALVQSGVTKHPVLERTLGVIGSACINGTTWKPRYIQKHWPITILPPQRGQQVGSPWLSLRGLRIVKA
ncbi:MAG: hypothetical protein ACXADB_04435 [Candidatus Hermodarchaeia archaeon]|jgi:hypothetical protein